MRKITIHNTGESRFAFKVSGESVQILPGDNFLKPGTWEKIKAYPHVAKRVAEGVLVEGEIVRRAKRSDTEEPEGVTEGTGESVPDES